MAAPRQDYSSDDLSQAAAENPAPINSSLTGVAHPPKIRRRNRMITSCLECRRRKLRCNRSHPCVNCTKANRDCVFLAPATDAVAQLKLNEMKERMGDLEQGLVRNAAARGDTTDVTENDGIAGEESFSLNLAGQSGPEALDEQRLVATPCAVEDAAYDDDADDALMDLGIQLGKVRLTERIGGFFRPKFSEEIDLALKITDDGLEYTPPASSGRPSLFYNEGLQSSLKPPPNYLEPSAGFPFGGVAERSTLMDYLPSRSAADRLIRQYFDAVHYIARLVHRPTFERQYRSFWAQVSLGIEPVPSLQALVFAAMFSAVVSMPEESILAEFGVDKAKLTENFRLGTESALAWAKFLRTSKVETLQAFVMYLVPLCRDQLSRTHTVLVATAIRIAECMGLHRDGTNYGLSPLETHIRRLIWYQICFLDVRSCETHGPRPSIRSGDFDTKFPLNVNDVAFESSSPPTQDASSWTDMTFARIRFECYEIHRMIWFDRQRLERKEITLTHLLGKVDKFRRSMQEKYLAMIDDSVPLQRYARLVFRVLVDRIFLMVLHRYMASARRKIPNRLRQLVLSSGVEQLESAMEMETVPEFKPWLWYSGTYQQYHSGLLLLIEIYFDPKQPLADRIWRVLDYTFEVPPNLPREAKARRILTEARDKTDVYREMRKMRAPASLDSLLAPRIESISQQYHAARRAREASAGSTSTSTGLPTGSPLGPRQPSSLLSSFNLPSSTFLPAPPYATSGRNRLDTSFSQQQQQQQQQQPTTVSPAQSTAQLQKQHQQQPASPSQYYNRNHQSFSIPQEAQSPLRNVSNNPVPLGTSPVSPSTSQSPHQPRHSSSPSTAAPAYSPSGAAYQPPATRPTPLGFVGYADRSVARPAFDINFAGVANGEVLYAPTAPVATGPTPMAGMASTSPGASAADSSAGVTVSVGATSTSSPGVTASPITGFSRIAHGQGSVSSPATTNLNIRTSGSETIGMGTAGLASSSLSPTNTVLGGQHPVRQNSQTLHHPLLGSASTSSSSPDELMMDIDWDEWDKLFPLSSVE